MEDIIVPLGFFAMVAFVIHVIVTGIVRSRLLARQSQVIRHVIDKAASESASAAFLESPFGRSLLDGADRRTVILTHTIGAAQTFLVLTIVGITLLIFYSRATEIEERTALLAMGILGIVVGIAFLIGAFATWFVARRWGLIDRAKPTPVQDPTDARTSDREPILR